MARLRINGEYIPCDLLKSPPSIDMILANARSMFLKKLAQADYDCCLRTFGGNRLVIEATIDGDRIAKGTPVRQYRYSQEEQRVHYNNNRREPLWIFAIRGNNALVACTDRSDHNNINRYHAEIDTFINTDACRRLLGKVEILP